MSTDNLIREALQRQAERAVDPERIRAALPVLRARRSRRRRYGALVTAAAGLVVAALAVVAATATVPTLLLGGHPAGPRPAGSVTPSAVASAPAPAAMPTAFHAALRYSPTWLPAGLKERTRTISSRPDSDAFFVDRTWASGPAGTNGEVEGARLEVTFADGASMPDVPEPGQTAVDINGKQGWLYGATLGSKSGLQWKPDPKTVIILSQHQLAGGVDLVKIARSFQPDQGQMTVPLRLTWLPAGVTMHAAVCGGDSATSWECRIGGGATSASKNSSRSVEVAMGTRTAAPDGGAPVTVGGRPARFLRITDDGRAQPEAAVSSYLVVDLGQGRLLTVFAFEVGNPGGVPPTQADLMKIAEGTEIGQPDLSWLGSR